MGHLVGNAGLLDGGDRVTSSDDGDGVVHVGQGVGDRKGSLGEGIELEHSHRSVPDDGLAVSEALLEEVDRLGADVKSHPSVRNVRDVNDLGVGIRGELVGDDDIDRQDELDSLGLGLDLELLGELDLVLLDERGADREAYR